MYCLLIVSENIAVKFQKNEHVGTNIGYNEL